MNPADRCDRILGDRFRPLRLLKSARGIDTWFASDRDHPDPVLVKTVDTRAVPASLKRRLEHEAEALRVLSSPFCAPPIAIGQDGGVMFLATPWVAGEPLAERLRRGPLTSRETLRVGRCLLGALVEVHQRGVVHGDIRPSNVIVDAGAARVVLTDFGLARGAILDVAGADLPASAERHGCPEQAGPLDAVPEERSDLYSVGAVLSACLAGQPTSTRGGATDATQAAPEGAPGPRAMGSMPRALHEVVQRLMRAAPRERYQSAAGALADLEEIERELIRGRAEPSLAIGLHDTRSTLGEPAFVDRAQELSVLEAHLDRARQGHGALVLLEAESGMGKTRILDELARRCEPGLSLFRGRGVVEVGAHPFPLLSGVMSGLVALARREPATASALCEKLRDRREALCAVFPELTALFGPVAVRESGPENLGEPRTLSAFAALLAALGSEARPALVLLDDCQWASDVVLKLLQTFHEQRSGADRSCHVLVVVSFRSEEVPEGHQLRRMAGAPLMALPPLDDGAVKQLLESMAGALPLEAVGVGQRLSAGSPFMAAAVLRGMVECGALVPGEGGFRVDPTAIRDVRSSRAAAEFLLRRMEKLPPHVLRLLSVGAVLGREFSVDCAAKLSGQSSAELLVALAEARRRHIVWFRDHGARVVFVHDKLRETLLARLRDEERKGLHLQAALHLEAKDPGRSFEIAYHFDAAGAPQRALSYALAAGSEARSRHALDVAEQHYRIARRGAPEEDDAVRLRVAEGLGDVLMLRGRYGDAAREFVEARRLARGQIDGARLEGKLGELAFKSGDVATAGRHVEDGLQLLGRRVPRRSFALILQLAREVLVQALHTILPRVFVGRRELAGSEAEFLAIHLHSRLAHVYWFQRGNSATLWTHLREMNLAERYPPTLPLAQAYSEHAPVMTMIPWFSRGIAYARRSYEIRKALGDTWGQGQSLHFLGVVLYAASRFQESIESCKQAIRLLEQTGDQWEVNTARWHIGYCHYRLGALRAAVDEARRVVRAGEEIGDAQARGIGLAIWAKASSGRVPEEATRGELARTSADVHTCAEVQQAEAVRLLAAGRTADAVAMLREARRRVERAGLKQEYVAPVLPWLTAALRRQVEEVPPHAPARRAALLREALSVSRRAVRLARSYRNNLAHALRERALLQATRGRARAARRSFDASLAWAERLGMRGEAAHSRLARGRVGLLAGWAGGEEDIAAAERALQEMEAELAVEPPIAGTPASISPAEALVRNQALTEEVARREQELRDAQRHEADFIGVLSHELRNPLAAIRTSVYVLGMAPPDTETATRARAIVQRQLDHLVRLTDDLLDVARIGRGMVCLLREDLDLAAVARRAAEDQRRLFEQHGVELELVTGGEPIRVNADAARLAQVIGNLLENAAKFTPPGGRAVLSLERKRGEVEISVRDTGRGIEPSLLEHLFDPFVQADRSLARSGGGLGLGLALVKEMVELHGGSVSAFSEGAGKGATFVVRLPLQPGGAAASAAVA